MIGNYSKAARLGELSRGSPVGKLFVTPFRQEYNSLGELSFAAGPPRVMAQRGPPLSRCTPGCPTRLTRRLAAAAEVAHAHPDSHIVLPLKHK